MNENKRKALSSFAEIKDRCTKRATKIKTVVSTKHENVFVVIFEDGTQANVNYETLTLLHQDTPELWSKEHHLELV